MSPHRSLPSTWLSLTLLPNPHHSTSHLSKAHHPRTQTHAFITGYVKWLRSNTWILYSIFLLRVLCYTQHSHSVYKNAFKLFIDKYLVLGADDVIKQNAKCDRICVILKCYKLLWLPACRIEFQCQLSTQQACYRDITQDENLCHKDFLLANFMFSAHINKIRETILSKC